MKNYYQTLGIDRNASPDEIKRAYRRLASQHHPDKGGDKNQFQEIEEAYRTLSDDQKRANYDNPSPFGGGFGPGMGGQPFNFESIFDMFGTRFQHQHRPKPQARMTLWITLKDSAEGFSKTVSVGSQHGTTTLDIEIPLGIGDSDTVQYNGLAPGGMDLIVTFRLHPDPIWQRRNYDLLTEKDISIWDCILGTEITLYDVLGNQLLLTIPPRTQPGSMLRLRGRGMTQRQTLAKGDILVKINATIPDNIDQDLLDKIAQKRQ